MAKFESELFHLQPEDGQVVVKWRDWDEKVVAETDWTPDAAEEFSEHLIRMAALARKQLERSQAEEKNEVTFRQ